MKAALDELLAVYASVTVDDFGPRRLTALREAMMVDKIGKQRSRVTMNGQVSRIRRLFRWGDARELVPASIAHGHVCVPGLRRGETDKVSESRPVRPIAVDVAEQAADAAPPTVAAMIRLQLHTGMRPAELCRVRTMDVDQTGDVWLYRPASHKTEAHGIDRVIPIGPAGQAALGPFLSDAEPDAFVFSPARAEEERDAEQRRQALRRYGDWARPNRARDEVRAQRAAPNLSECYDTASYRKAVTYCLPNGRDRAVRAEPTSPRGSHPGAKSCGT